MKIWVDADACPRDVKRVVFRASERVQVEVVLVANQMLETPPSPLVSAACVRHGPDEADEHIERMAADGDIVVTADIPLAAKVVERGAIAIDPRGEVYDEGNVRQRLAARNLMDHLRSQGLVHGGPPTFNAQDTGRFANALDRELTRRLGK